MARKRLQKQAALTHTTVLKEQLRPHGGAQEQGAPHSESLSKWGPTSGLFTFLCISLHLPCRKETEDGPHRGVKTHCGEAAQRVLDVPSHPWPHLPGCPVAWGVPLGPCSPAGLSQRRNSRRLKGGGREAGTQPPQLSRAGSSREPEPSLATHPQLQLSEALVVPRGPLVPLQA